MLMPVHFRFNRHLFILSRFVHVHKHPMVQTLKTDVLIIGGGIAGLWLLNRLRNAGYAAWLFEQDALGAGQSIASQGMIHGGIKYALGGKHTGASSTIANMPAHWKQCLAGEGDVDLRGCNLLSESYYMWPRESLRSRLNAFLGSKAIEGRVSTVAAADFPAFFRGNIQGPLYQLQDIVLDVPSLLQTLASRFQDCLYRINWDEARLESNAEGDISGLAFSNGERVEASRYIFCCGGGNDTLLKRFKLDCAPMQRRPLGMLMVQHDIETPLFVHCVSEKLSMTPEVTVTSHRNASGKPVWYLGGELAEQGAHMDDETLMAAGKKKLAELFPWCDFSQAHWDTLRIDRAEARQPGGKRPNDFHVSTHHNYLVAWPTKLTLSPNMANHILDMLANSGVSPTSFSDDRTPDYLDRPEVVGTPWEGL
jgi:hypothetical protein